MAYVAFSSLLNLQHVFVGVALIRVSHHKVDIFIHQLIHFIAWNQVLVADLANHLLLCQVLQLCFNLIVKSYTLTCELSILTL